MIGPLHFVGMTNAYGAAFFFAKAYSTGPRQIFEERDKGPPAFSHGYINGAATNFSKTDLSFPGPIFL